MIATDLVGYLASVLVLATFCMRDMVALRCIAITSNLAFIAYGGLAGLVPVLLLHLLLLPVNALRLAGWRTSASGPSMKDLETLVDLYCEGWSHPSAMERERLIRCALTADATYCDPRTSVLNVHALLEYITKIQEDRPGAQVRRTGAVDTHHGFGRFSWDVVLPGGTTLLEGIDFVELTADRSKINRIIGFFGTASPPAPERSSQ